MIQGGAIITIVHAVIVDRRKPHQENGAADEGPGALRIAENVLGTQ
jgi:hypothetical protein